MPTSTLSLVHLAQQPASTSSDMKVIAFIACHGGSGDHGGSGASMTAGDVPSRSAKQNETLRRWEAVQCGAGDAEATTAAAVGGGDAAMRVQLAGGWVAETVKTRACVLV